MTSTKIQINLNVQKFNDQNSFKLFDYLIIDFWNLSIRTSCFGHWYLEFICYLLFGACNLLFF